MYLPFLLGFHFPVHDWRYQIWRTSSWHIRSMVRVWDNLHNHFDNSQVRSLSNNVSASALFTYHTFRLLALLALPHTLCNMAGLVSINTFPEKPVFKSSPLLAPFICIRVVTRGLYPNLVKKTVRTNLNTLLDAGLENFTIQVRQIRIFKTKEWWLIWII